jgi:hypothetical protein
VCELILAHIWDALGSSSEIRCDNAGQIFLVLWIWTRLIKDFYSFWESQNWITLFVINCLILIFYESQGREIGWGKQSRDESIDQQMISKITNIGTSGQYLNTSQAYPNTVFFNLCIQNCILWRGSNIKSICTIKYARFPLFSCVFNPAFQTTIFISFLCFSSVLPETLQVINVFPFVPTFSIPSF